MTDIARLNTGPNDAERAENIRAELRPVLEHACAIISEARRNGLNVGFNLGMDQYGTQRIMSLDIHKSL